MANHPVFTCVFHGEVAKVKTLLMDDPSLVSIRDAKNLTPVHVAASRGKEEVLRLLIDHGADVHGPSDADQWTPLVFAAYRGHVRAVKILIENGAGVTAADGNPIHYAGQRKHKEICQILADHGAIDDVVGSDDPALVRLFRAAYSYDPKTVESMLAERPEWVSHRDVNGRTLLHEACTHGDTKTVRVLLQNGADAKAPDHHGQTPEDRASSHRQHNVTKILKKHLSR
jgi:ankyrin repeat protein